jgi:3-hydroxymyristoyl/3-hydroxydecanoyl-(acyl carrier protein) dehydratase
MRYVFLDRITDLEPAVLARAVKCVSLAEDVFRDHFPGSPVLPGALLIESMAQLAGVLVEETAIANGNDGMLALLVMVDKARFRRPVKPGDKLELEARAVSVDELKASVKTTATVDGVVVAQAELGFVLGTDHPPELVAERRRWVKLWREGTAW